MSEKRFECVFIEDDEFGGTFRRLKDNETGIVHMTCDVVDLLNFQNTQIKCLKEDNEKLKKRLYLYEMNEDEVDKYLRTHPMPTITNEKTITPLDMRHRW